MSSSGVKRVESPRRTSYALSPFLTVEFCIALEVNYDQSKFVPAGFDSARRL